MKTTMNLTAEEANGCVNCGDTDVPLDDEGWCAHCLIEIMQEEEKERRQRDDDIIAAQKWRDERGYRWIG